jgi:nucleoside transporter
MADGPEQHSASGVRTKLSIMMFLEFFIWGAWLPLIFGFLKTLSFDDTQQSWVLNAFAMASFTAMFFFTQFADRTFAAERFVAFSHLVGGLAMMALTWTTSFGSFFLLMLVHSLFYVPTISITNSIAFANLKDTQREFGPVRLWGTIGWIAAALPYALNVPQTSMFMVSGIGSLVLAAFSMTLPHTPPRPAAPGAEKFAWLEAMKLLNIPYLLVLFVVTFFDAGVHQGYFILTGGYLTSIGIPGRYIASVMSVGQIAEIVTMAVLGYFLKRLGWRKIMVLGILGHTIRFGIFALVPSPPVAIIVNFMHGICYAFFFATVYIFVDEFFPKNARSSAQGLFNFLILGLGPFVGNIVWPMLSKSSEVEIPFTENRPAIVVAAEQLNVALSGTAAPNADVHIKIHTPDNKPLVEVNAKANEKGAWTIPEQHIVVEGAPSYHCVSEGDAVITRCFRVDYRKLLLYPSGTALFAAILLLLFFHPPKTKTPDDAAVALSEGADVPAE